MTVYPIEIAFATNSQRIVVQVETVEGVNAPDPTPATSDTPHITLTEEEKLKLNEGKSGGSTRSTHIDYK